MIQLGEPLNRKKTIKCPSCGDRILYVLHDRKSGDRLRYQDVRFLQPTTVKNPLYCSKCDSPWINKSTGRVICKASKIKPSELTGCKCRKDKAITLKDGFYTDGRGSFISIENGMMIPCICPMPGTEVNFREIFKFPPHFNFPKITGPGITEMLKAEKVKKRTGYKASSIIIDECKPLTRRQIKEVNESLNKLNARKPTKKRVTR